MYVDFPNQIKEQPYLEDEYQFTVQTDTSFLQQYFKLIEPLRVFLYNKTPGGLYAVCNGTSVSLMLYPSLSIQVVYSKKQDIINEERA